MNLPSHIETNEDTKSRGPAEVMRMQQTLATESKPALARSHHLARGMRRGNAWMDERVRPFPGSSTGIGVLSANRRSEGNACLHNRSCSAWRPPPCASPYGEHRTAKVDAGPGEELRPPIKRRMMAILADQHVREQGWSRRSAGDRRSGAGAWASLPQARQAYFGRVMRSTRSCAGTQSSISLTLSPRMRRATATGAASRSTSSRTSSRGR